MASAAVRWGVVMIILKDPAAARSLGLLGTKAQLTAGSADWPTFLNLLGQALAVGGVILFAFLTAWVFGREFADRTVRGLLARPTSRRTIVVAKYLVIATWGLAVATLVIALGLGVGALIGLPGWSTDGAVRTIEGIGLGATLTIALQAATAFFAGLGHGYLAPLAWAILTIVASRSWPSSAGECGFPGRCPPSWRGRAGLMRRRSRWVGSPWWWPSSPAWSRRSPGGNARIRPADGSWGKKCAQVGRSRPSR